MKKDLSIIIITWNQLDTTCQCLESLKNWVSNPAIEIIVVDNGSKDRTSNFLLKHYPSVRLVVNEENKGVAYARNRALEKARGKYILILDNDTLANDTAITGMIDYMEEHQTVGLCACSLTDATGNLQDSFKPFPALKIKIKNVLKRNNVLVKALTLPTKPIEPDYVIGACQLVRRSVLDKVGLLDERIFYGPEDADFCLRIAGEGYKIVYLPQYSIIHHWQRATTRKIFSRLAWKHFYALCYFYIKHKRID